MRPSLTPATHPLGEVPPAVPGYGSGPRLAARGCPEAKDRCAMMVGRHLPSFAAAIPARGSTAVQDRPQPDAPEVSTIPEKPIAIQRAWRANNGQTQTRPIMLAIAGDSASGKTTITKGLVEALGADRITSICVDDYHRYDRIERKN